MKKTAVGVLAAAIVAALVVLSGAALAKPDRVPEPELIAGQVISLYGYMSKGLQGEEFAEAGEFQTRQRGLPVAILDEEKGLLYIAVYKGGISAADKLAPLMGKMVFARGPVYREYGINLIEIQIVSEQ